MKHAGRTIDLDLMKKRLEEGYNDGAVAKELGCSRQYVGIRRKKWEEAGELRVIPLDERKGRGGQATVVVDTKRKDDGSHRTTSLEELIEAAELVSQNKDVSDFLLSHGDFRRDLAKQVTINKALIGLRHEVKGVRERNIKLEKENKQLREGKLAYQQGEVNPPLSSSGGKPSQLVPEPIDNLVRTIYELVNLEAIANTVPLLNISEGAFCFS